MAEDIKVKFELGDRVVGLATGEEGVVTRLCSDKGAVFVRWSLNNAPVMVDVDSLRRVQE